MIKELITKETIRFAESAENWEEAIRIGAEPLIEIGVIGAGYIDDIIKNVKEKGPYIVIYPGLALPHARSEHAYATGLSYLRLNEPVDILDRPDRSAQVFITLSATDNTTHLEAMRELAKILVNKEYLERFLNAQNVEDVLSIIDETIS